METTPTVERLDVMTEAVRRLRQQYRERLIAVYAMPDIPYEPSGDDKLLYLVGILRAPLDVDAELDTISAQFDAVSAEFGDAITVMGSVTVPGEDLAQRAQLEGVRL